MKWHVHCKTSISGELSIMNNFKFAITKFLLIFTFSAISTFASTLDNDKDVALVTKNLSAKLKADLVSNNVSVVYKSVEKTQISNTETIVKGNAVAVVPSDNTQLPIKFEAKINPIARVVDDVEYAFVESVESNYAPSNDEEFLMKHLLKKLAADYKTENVVIAIDGFETQNAAENQKEYKGTAEIRVGEVEWRKINFDVTLNAKNEASKIEYNLKK